MKRAKTLPGELGKKRVWTAREIAQAIGWTTDRVTRALKKSGAGFRIGDSGVWMATEATMRRHIPEFFEQVECERDAAQYGLDPEDCGGADYGDD